MSATSCVPATVPSVRQRRCEPPPTLSSTKKRKPPKKAYFPWTSKTGFRLGPDSLRGKVPARVPSDRQRRWGLLPAPPRKNTTCPNDPRKRLVQSNEQVLASGCVPAAVPSLTQSPV